MGDPGSMVQGSSASTDDNCLWTEVCASQLASRNKEHLDVLQLLPVYDRSLVSVGRQIGEGGQGCVYEAKFHLPYFFKPVPVVVKKFKPLVGVSQGQFPPEILSMKPYSLCIPYGVFFEGDSFYMIMRQFSCDLRAVIDCRLKFYRDFGLHTHRPLLPEQYARSIILQLAVGLTVLHERGVYHGDLKAANILLRTFGQTFGKNNETLRPVHVVIADFERSEGVVGTGYWRAPEVLQSLITRVPLSKEQWLLADVYSFGMVCYEVFTGMIPFHGHKLSDYDLVLNGGRPELPDHVPESMRDLILKCWHADPLSRPSWTDILEVLEQRDDAVVTGEFRSYVDNALGVESLSLESLIHESKQLVRDLTALHESDPRSFRSEFMPYYWTSEFLATAEEFASRFVVDSVDPEEEPLECSVQDFFETFKLLHVMRYQVTGTGFGCMAFLDVMEEQHSDTKAYVQRTIRQKERLQGMLATVTFKLVQNSRSVQLTEEFEVGTSWTGKLSFFHALVMWFLWHEYAADAWEREFMVKRLVPTHWSLETVREALLIFFCMMVNAYMYVLAMITYEPILLVLQYGLYKAKGCNNILYRSSGKRICRFQRAWMNCTRYKVVSITLSFSFVSLLTIYGWRGILGWILFPCVIIYTPYWRQPINPQ